MLLSHAILPVLLVLASTNSINSQDCASNVDVIFVVDGSGSIRRDDFALVRNFLAMIVDGLPDDALVSAVQYASSNQLEFDFNAHQTRDAAKAALLALNQLRGGTKTGAALDFVTANLLSAGSGNRPGAEDIVIVLTDGKSTDDAYVPAHALRDTGALILAVGVGKADRDELVLIAGGDDSLVFLVDNFGQLDIQLSQAIMKRTMCADNPNFSCEGRADGTYENPFDACSPVWFTCTAGVMRKNHCNRGLRFEIVSGYCHLPQYVPGCGGETTLVPKPTLPVIPFDCSAGDGDFQNPEEACSIYYISCGGGVAYTRECPGGLMFDTVSSNCQPKASSAGCGGSTPPEATTSAVSTVAPEEFDCSSRDDGNHADPSAECSEKYYSCVGGVGYARNCVSGTFFDTGSGLCLFREYVAGCGGSFTEAPEISTFKPGPPPFPFDCVGKDDGGYNHPVLECSPQYVSCSNGIAIYLLCPDGLDFDVKSQKCLHRDYILYCGGLPTAPPTLPPATTQQPLFREYNCSTPFDCKTRDDGLYADPNTKCQPFFALCSGEFVYYDRCADAQTMAYDPVSQSCLLKEFVADCGGSPTTPATTVSVTPGLPPFAFDCVGKSDGSYNNPVLECSPEYVSCSNGIAIFLVCPAGLDFDIESQKCLQRDYILGCGGAPTEPQTPAPATTQKPLFPFDCTSRDDGLYPCSTKCKPFFALCSGGIVYYEQCANAQTMAYDPVSQRCLLKEFVEDCGGTPTTPSEILTVTPGLPPFELDCSGQPDGPKENPSEPCSAAYAVCNNGRTSHLRCFGPLKFDILSGLCLRQEFVKSCGGQVTVSEPPPPPPPTRPPVDYDCDDHADGFFPSLQSECSNIFFSCVGGIAYELRCPGNTFFDVISGECLRKPYVAACGGEATTKAIPTRPGGEATATPPPFDCWNLEDGKYAAPNVNCPSFYYYCEQRETYRVDCPGSSRYIDGECVHPALVPSCGLGGATSFCSERVNGFYRDEQYCDRYIACAENVQFSLHCLKDQVYDVHTRQCKHPSEVFQPCGTKGPSNYLTCQHKKNGFYTSPDHCGVYCECRDEQKYILTCNEGYAYDSESGYCIPAIYVPGCGPPPEVYYEDFCVSVGKGGLYGHPENCNQFILCANDYPLVMDCEDTFNKPATPFWSSARKTCVVERPDSARCRGPGRRHKRQEPESDESVEIGLPVASVIELSPITELLQQNYSLTTDQISNVTAFIANPSEAVCNQTSDSDESDGDKRLHRYKRSMVQAKRSAAALRLRRVKRAVAPAARRVKRAAPALRRLRRSATGVTAAYIDSFDVVCFGNLLRGYGLIDVEINAVLALISEELELPQPSEESDESGSSGDDKKRRLRRRRAIVRKSSF